MFSVLIAEDEMLVRIGLKTMIQWAGFDMYVCADVADGQSALEVYEKQKPDIIITDLRMPVMSGMELIERIRSKDRKTKIIILTCLDEFDLVRKAISLGVSDYIPKVTMVNSDLESILEKIRLELTESNESKSSQLPQDRDMVKEKLLKEFMLYHIYSAEEFENQIKRLNLRLSQKRLVLCMMETANFNILKEKFKDDDGQLIKFTLLNVLNEFLSGTGQGEAFFYDPAHYVLLFSFENLFSELCIKQELSTVLKNLQMTLQGVLNVHVSFGVSSIRSGYNALNDMYREAAHLLEQKFFAGGDQLFTNEQEEISNQVQQKIETLRGLPVLLKHLDRELETEYNRKIDKLQDVVKSGKEKVRTFFIQIVHWTASVLNIRDAVSGEVIVKYSNRMLQSEVLDELIEAYGAFAAEIAGKVTNRKAMHQEISRALLYMQKYYSMDIDLQAVASHVGLSTAYLSNLFKKELSVSFVEYLNELRVEKAKLLLLDTPLKSYEIAQRVGFSEHTYFSKVFKKLTGVNPSEFRRQLIRDYDGEMEDENAEI